MISQIRKLIQDKLISGINIKTINGADILGPGNLTVTGSGVSDGDYGDITVSGSGATWTIDDDTIGLDELSATGTPTASNFLRGDNTWATPASTDPAGWTTIVKSANQDVTNSITLVDDTDLQFSVVAGGQYMVELDIATAGNSTAADYKFAFLVSSGTMKLRGLALLITGGGSIGNVLISAAGTATTTAVSSAILNNDFQYIQPMMFKIQFTATSNATFSFQFANNTAAIGQTSRTMKGSILKYKKIN